MRRTIRNAVSAAMLSVTTVFVACAPIMSHGPRVVDGTQVGVSAAVVGGIEGEARTALIPYLSEGNRREDGSAEQFGVQLVIPMEGSGDDVGDSLLMGLQWDYYRERTSTDSTLARGWGVHGTLTQLMPYIQMGVYSGEFGVFTTQGIGTIGPYLGLPPYAVFWSPGFGTEYRSGIVTVRVQISTMIAATIFQGEVRTDPPLSLGLSIAVSEPNAPDAEPAD